MNQFSLRDAWNAAIAQLQSEKNPDGLIALLHDGHITRLEVLDNIWKHCSKDDCLKIVVKRMLAHPDLQVCEIGTDIQDTLQLRNNRVTDFNTIVDQSPLQPGNRIRLTGAYDPTHWWLNGHTHYDATFIRFLKPNSGKMPIAAIEFDHEIRMIEHAGQHHLGRLGLLRLRYVSDWDSSETVGVHIIQSLPDDVDEFYESHEFGSEIESHATYTLLLGKRI